MGNAKTSYVKGTPKTNYGFYTIFGIVTYFIWCDLSFFGELAAEKAQDLKLDNGTLLSQKTIKLRTQDHFGHYIFLPFCEWFDKTFAISNISWVSPNLITGLHFCIAIISGRMIAMKSFMMRRLAVILYETRSMLDVLDGVVFRAQSTAKDFLSGWGTYGYMIDGLADTVGGLFVMFGTIYRLNKYPPYKNPEVVAKFKSKLKDNDLESNERLLSSEDSCSEETAETYGLKRYSRQAVNLTVVFFTITVIARSGLWDHFNHSYHDLLGVKRADIPPEKQFEVLNYGSTWFCLWLWTVSSADAFMHFTLATIFFGKLWQDGTPDTFLAYTFHLLKIDMEYGRLFYTTLLEERVIKTNFFAGGLASYNFQPWLRFNLYAGIPSIFIVSSICEIHLMQMRRLLGVKH